MALPCIQKNHLSPIGGGRRIVMKITPTLRALLVAMCLCMVFSLFACAEDTTTITDSPATDAPTEEKTEEKTEAPTSEKTEAPTQEKTEAPHG